MKILFVNPIFQLDGFSLLRKTKQINLGLPYLASIALKSGHEATIKLVNKFNFRNVLEKVDPDIVAVSMMYIQYPSGVEIIKQTKEFNKKIVTMAGGYVPTFRYEELLKKCDELDYAVIGEGEVTFDETLRFLEGKIKKIEKIRGLAFKKNNNVVFTGKRELIKNLDSIPFPARELVDFKVPDISASRGCNYNCKFCCIKNFYGGTIRRRSVSNVIEELEILKKNRYKSLNFNDDSFLMCDSDWILKLCKEIRANDLDKMKYVALATTNYVLKHSKLLEELKKSNFRQLNVGIQSLNEKGIKYLQLSFNLEKIKRLISLIRKNNDIRFKLFYIINSTHPYENKKTIKRGIIRLFDLIEGLENIEIEPCYLIPYPGCDIEEELRRKGIISIEKYHPLDVMSSVIYNYNNIKADEVNEIYKWFVEELCEKGILKNKKKQFDQLICLLSSSFPLKEKINIIKDVIEQKDLLEIVKKYF